MSYFLVHTTSGKDLKDDSEPIKGEGKRVIDKSEDCSLGMRQTLVFGPSTTQTSRLDIVALACNPNTLQVKSEELEFKVKLSYTASLKPAWFNNILVI